MGTAIWALIACPPHFAAAERLDEFALQVAIPERVPLHLQRWLEEAEVCLLLLLLLSCCVAPPPMLLQLRRMLKTADNAPASQDAPGVKPAM